jgi:hypothetical protein
MPAAAVTRPLVGLREKFGEGISISEAVGDGHANGVGGLVA